MDEILLNIAAQSVDSEREQAFFNCYGPSSETFSANEKGENGADCWHARKGQWLTVVFQDLRRNDVSAPVIISELAIPRAVANIFHVVCRVRISDLSKWL